MSTRLAITTKAPDYFEPEAGTPHECYNNVYQEVLHNQDRIGVLGYIYKRGLSLGHCWYIDGGETVVDMTLTERGWSYVGYIIPTGEWVRRVKELGDNELNVLTDEERLELGRVARKKLQGEIQCS